MRDATGPYDHRYRIPRQMFVFSGIPTGFLIGVGAFVSGTSDDNPPLLRVLLPALMIGGFAWFLRSAARSGTYVSRSGIVTYGAIRRTSTPWQGIQGIEVASSGGADIVVIYDHQGCRLKLHQLNSSNVLSVEHEAQELRRLWERRRGSRWNPIPEVTARIGPR